MDLVPHGGMDPVDNGAGLRLVLTPGPVVADTDDGLVVPHARKEALNVLVVHISVCDGRKYFLIICLHRSWS